MRTATLETSTATQWCMRRAARAQTRTTNGAYIGHVALQAVFLPIIGLHSDYNFVRSGDQCVPAGPEPIPAGVCVPPSDTYLGSSGYRLIPGNTCDRDAGLKKDQQVEKPCSAGMSCLGAERSTLAISLCVTQLRRRRARSPTKL